MAKQTPNFGFTKPEPNDYYDVNVQNENWDKVDELLKEVATSGGVSPSNVTDARVKVANGKLTIFWSDPGDTVVGEDTICTWKGTKLVQKVGSYPENAKDGTVLVDNQVLDAYKTNGFEINGLTNGVTYYFALFPYSDTGATNISTKNLLSGTPQPYKIMTAVIDLSDSNPNTCVSYADDAVGVVAGSAEWDEFFGHYPVLFKDGAEVGKLNPNNFDQFEDGTTADISSGASGDAMICFPRRGLTITTSGTKLTISMTDNPDNNAFEYNAHKRGNVAKEKFYIGVPTHFSATMKVDNKEVTLYINHPYNRTISEKIYLVSVNAQGSYCVVEIVREPWQWVSLAGIVLLLVGALMLFLRGPRHTAKRELE